MTKRWAWIDRRLDVAGIVVLLAATVLYAAVVAAVALSSASSQRGDARQGSIDEAKGQLSVVAAFSPRLVSNEAPLSTHARLNLGAAWDRLEAANGTAGTLRMWRVDGSLLYDSAAEPARHAAPFAPGSIARDGWSETHDAAPGRAAELHVYLPVLVGGRVGGVAELAEPLAPLLADEAAQGRVPLRRFSLGGAILWLVLLPVGLRLAAMVGRAWDPRRLRLLRRMRRGLAAGELEVHYQPKVTIASGAVESVEALVRWRRDGQLVPPGSFLPVVEQSPLIRDLTLSVLDTALADVRRWERDGLHVTVAVNIAPVSLGDPRLADDVAGALRRHGLDADRLILEVTETGVVDDDVAAGGMLERLAGLGVCLSVDDFGTGHSSVERISRYPFTELKIDRSFVMELASQQRPIVATMVGMAKTLGLRIVAEGVEDDAALNALRALGCDVAQGYLLGRPMPAADVVDAAVALHQQPCATGDVRVLLDRVRESLQLDAAFIAEFVGDQQVFRFTAGDGETFATHEAGSQALCESYCARVVDGVFPNLIANAPAHAAARALPVTGLRGIGAYIGVQLQRPDGSLYGTLCGLSKTPRPELGDEDVAALTEVGKQLTPLLKTAHLAVSAG